MRETVSPSRLLFKVENSEWADTLVYNKPSIPPKPSIREGDIIEAQLWMMAESIKTPVQTTQGIRYVNTSKPNVVVDCVVERLEKVHIMSEHRDYLHMSVNPGVPMILVSKSSDVSGSQELIGKMVEAQGVLSGSVSIWTGPIFSPVAIHILSIKSLPDESRLIAGVISKGKTITRVKHA